MRGNHKAVQNKLSNESTYKILKCDFSYELRVENTGKLMKFDVNFREFQIQHIEVQFDQLNIHTFSHTQMYCQ